MFWKNCNPDLKGRKVLRAKECVGRKASKLDLNLEKKLKK